MSYVQVTPEYYRRLQPDSVSHAGSPGWTQAPFPGWGMNPARTGPSRVGVHGLGAMVRLRQPTAGKLVGLGQPGGQTTPAAAPTEDAPTKPLTQLVQCSGDHEPVVVPKLDEDGSKTGREGAIYYEVACLSPDMQESSAPQAASGMSGMLMAGAVGAVGGLVAGMLLARRK